MSRRRKKRTPAAEAAAVAGSPEARRPPAGGPAEPDPAQAASAARPQAAKPNAGGGARASRQAGPAKIKAGTRHLLINVADPELVRVAILGAAGLEDVFIERTAALDGLSHGNIYKGRIQNVEPALQAAFVDLGGPKNGFLHFNDILPPRGGCDDGLAEAPRSAAGGHSAESASGGPGPALQRGQEVLVQINRETLGHKGPSVTTRLSIPGRYLVLVPSDTRRGVSRKITDEAERQALKKALDQLAPARDAGYIIRTAGMGRGKEELQGDLDGLGRLWEAIKARAKSSAAPALLYRETDLVLRVIRDYVYDDVAEIVVDSADAFSRAREFLAAVMPEFAARLRLHQGPEPLFGRYRVEDAIERTFDRSVRLESGAELIIEQTEALVAIDVNSSRFRTEESGREAILAVNREAAAEAARQLRLRDLGGLVMVDFIDMEDARDRREVEGVFRQAMAGDRARSTVLPISPLGVMELTRQRLRQSLKKTFFSPCPACGGSGVVKGAESLGLDFMRRIRQQLDAMEAEGGDRPLALAVTMNPETALRLGNLKRAVLAQMEMEAGVPIHLAGDPSMRLDDLRFAHVPAAAGPRRPAAPPARPQAPAKPAAVALAGQPGFWPARGGDAESGTGQAVRNGPIAEAAPEPPAEASAPAAPAGNASASVRRPRAGSRAKERGKAGKGEAPNAPAAPKPAARRPKAPPSERPAGKPVSPASSGERSVEAEGGASRSRKAGAAAPRRPRSPGLRRGEPLP